MNADYFQMLLFYFSDLQNTSMDTFYKVLKMKQNLYLFKWTI